MKKILLLGGSAQQVIAIETAKKLGYYTVLCDYLTDNPGQYKADKFYLVSTTDKEAVLKVAMEEDISGVLAYASDPAAPTAAYVAEKMGLPGNPYESVEILCNKDRFRKFLLDNGFNSPAATGYTNVEAAINDIDKYNFPVIVKPVDSSGSKGATVIRSRDRFKEAVELAFSFSRGHRIIIEEFIEKKHLYLIGGDIFVINGRVVIWGLMNCHRDNNVNSLVPVGKSYPLKLAEYDIENIKKTLQHMIDKLHITNGAMNVELIVDKNNKVWPIDVGPRCGGNMIPDLLSIIFNVDVVEWSVKAALGISIDADIYMNNLFFATHNLHCNKNGIFRKIEFSSKLEEHIVRRNIYKKDGDYVEYFDNASKALGIIFLKYNSQNEMLESLEHITDEIFIHID